MLLKVREEMARFSERETLGVLCNRVVEVERMIGLKVELACFAYWTRLWSPFCLSPGGVR